MKDTKIIIIALAHYMYVVCAGALIPEYTKNRISGYSFAIHLLVGYGILWLVIWYALNELKNQKQ